MNVLEQKTDVIILLAASYAMEWQGNVVGLGRASHGKDEGLQGKAPSDFIVICIFASGKSYTQSGGIGGHLRCR